MGQNSLHRKRHRKTMRSATQRKGLNFGLPTLTSKLKNSRFNSLVCITLGSELTDSKRLLGHFLLLDLLPRQIFLGKIREFLDCDTTLDRNGSKLKLPTM
jgi:hypothetical protein